jgi:hypothetical protein
MGVSSVKRQIEKNKKTKRIRRIQRNGKNK